MACAATDGGLFSAWACLSAWRAASDRRVAVVSAGLWRQQQHAHPRRHLRRGTHAPRTRVCRCARRADGGSAQAGAGYWAFTQGFFDEDALPKGMPKTGDADFDAW